MLTAKIGGDNLYETPACPVCSQDECIELYRCNKKTGTKLGEIEIAVAQCSQCGFVYNCPRVRQDILSEYYYSSPLASGQVYRDQGPQGYYTSLNITRVKFLSAFLKKYSSTI